MQFVVEIRLREGEGAPTPLQVSRLTQRYKRLIQSKLDNMLFEEVQNVHEWEVKDLRDTEHGRNVVLVAHARRITFDPHLDMVNKIDALIGVFS